MGVAYEMLSKGNSASYVDAEDLTVFGASTTGIRATFKYDFGTFALAGLFQFEVLQAYGLSPYSSLAAAQDAYLPAPGLAQLPARTSPRFPTC